MKNENETVKEIKTPEVEKFDGYLDYKDFDFEGKVTTTRIKFYLNSDEVKDFFKDNDPNKYWREGKIPVYFKKELGTLLSEDRSEVQLLRKIFVNHPDVLLFKHDFQNMYTLLIPKSHTEHEMRDGEFAQKFIFCDTRSIVFSGTNGSPSSYEPGFFKKRCDLILARLNAINARRSGMI